jgi:hypothetical protein
MISPSFFQHYYLSKPGVSERNNGKGIRKRAPEHSRIPRGMRGDTEEHRARGKRWRLVEEKSKAENSPFIT